MKISELLLLRQQYKNKWKITYAIDVTEDSVKNYWAD